MSPWDWVELQRRTEETTESKLQKKMQGNWWRQ